MMVNHSKTGHFCMVFECSTIILKSVDPNHSKTGPFVNWTHLDHLKTGLVQYSDGYCTTIKTNEHSIEWLACYEGVIGSDWGPFLNYDTKL